METTSKIFASIANKPVGSVIGGIVAYFFCKKLLGTDKILIIAPVVMVGALVGSGIEWKMTENINDLVAPVTVVSVKPKTS